MKEPEGKILVVDDNEDNRDLLARRLRRKGYAVDVAEDGPTALRMIEHDEYDLVLLDIMMPGMSGTEVLGEIRKTRDKASLPVLMATAKTESADVVEALGMGANDYVTKPIDFPVVVARIRSHLQVKAQADEKRGPTAVLAADGTVAPGSVLDGRYEVLSVLGEGGFAVVFAARQISTGQKVALKLLRAHRIAALSLAKVELARFEREMKLIGRLVHPHIVRLVDSGRLEVRRSEALTTGPEDTTASSTRRLGVPIPNTRSDEMEAFDPQPSTVEVPYLVMEYIEGRPLSRLLKTAGRLSVREAVDLMVPVISAVAAAHRSGVIHRDLKPPNIMVVKSPSGGVQPKVLDFGIAKLTSEEETTGLTQDAGFVGTPEYMSPEQARGAKAVTEKSDQYALAVILYECVTGARPYEAGSFIELVHRIGTGEFIPPSERVEGIPPGFEAVLLRAMDTDPARRFRSVESLGAALLPFASPEVGAQWEPAFGPEQSQPPPALGAALELEERERREIEHARTMASDSMDAVSPDSSTLDSRSSPTITLTNWAGRRSVQLTLVGLIVAALAAMTVLHLGSRDTALGIDRLSEGRTLLPAAGARYRVELEVFPEQATILLDGDEVGRGHFSGVFERDGTPHTLRASAPGYVPESLTFVDSPPPSILRLEPIGAP